MTGERTDYDSEEHPFAELRAKLLAGRWRSKLWRRGEDGNDLPQKMEPILSEFRFLSIFRDYTQRLSDAHEVVLNLDSLLIKIQAAAKAFREVVAAIDLNQSLHTFLPTFARLKEKVELLKPEIREAYLQYLSRHPFHPLPPNDQTSGWYQFCNLVMKNLCFLRKENDLVDPLGRRMQAFYENLGPLLWFRRCTAFPHCGEVVIQAAHVCCWYYYAGMDQNHMAVLMADLEQKIDLASPEFLERILEFLQHHRKYNVNFVEHMLHSVNGIVFQNVLYKDMLVSLLTCALKTMKLKKLDLLCFSKHICPLFVEARLIFKKQSKMGDVLLFGRIWFLRAEFFLKQPGGSTLFSVSIKDQIEVLHHGLRLLRQFITEIKDETANQMLTLIEEISRQMDALEQSSHAVECKTNKVRDVLYKFHVQIMLFRAKELLLELRESPKHFMFPVKRQMGTLHEGLVLVKAVAFNQFKEITEDEKRTLTYAEEVAASIMSLSESFPTEEMTEEAEKIVGLWLFDLLEKVQVLKAKLKDLYLHVPIINFAKIPALSFIEFLQKKLKRLLEWNLDSVTHITHQIETICEYIEILMSCFVDFEEKDMENQELKDFCTRLTHVAYEAEYVIDSLVVKSGDEWNQFLWLYHVSEEIRLIKTQVKIFQGKAFDVGVQNAVQTRRRENQQTRATGTGEDVVILNDQQKAIVNRLTRGSPHRDVISIVGMPGIGKTTLANKVYNDPAIVGYFHIRAWCNVSQVYTKRDLLLEILSHIIQLGDIIHAKKDEDLKLPLYQSLGRNRYLIFMDDMWDIGAWMAWRALSQMTKMEVEF